MEALVITPVKDSPETTRRTIEAVAGAKGEFLYLVYNDFSGRETTDYLIKNQQRLKYRMINLQDITDNPSPNYKLVLLMAQQRALEYKVPLILIESDVVIRENTICDLLKLSRTLSKPGIIGVATTDREGNYNFPYAHIRKDGKPWTETRRSLSFCCTMITLDFLEKYDFKQLSSKKDWFDIHISRQSRKLKFKNYLVKENGVLHLPHSSRPWKQLKYSDPLKYYLAKLFKRRDRI